MPTKRPPPDAERCVEQLRLGRCTRRKLHGSDKCERHEKNLALLKQRDPPHDNVVNSTAEIYRDPEYIERVEAWLGDPKKLLDYRHTMARCQALADMCEERVRIVRLRGGAELPPPLLEAIRVLGQLHVAIGRLEGRISDTTHVHVSLVNALVTNTIAVMTEFVPPERLSAALDKLRALQAAAVPPAGGPHGATAAGAAA